MRKTFKSLVHLAAMLVLSVGVAYASPVALSVGTSAGHIVLGSATMSDGWDSPAVVASIDAGSSGVVADKIATPHADEAAGGRCCDGTSVQAHGSPKSDDKSMDAIRWRMVSDGGGDCASCHSATDKASAMPTISMTAPADLGTFGRRTPPQLE